MKFLNIRMFKALNVTQLSNKINSHNSLSKYFCFVIFKYVIQPFFLFKASLFSLVDSVLCFYVNK